MGIELAAAGLIGGASIYGAKKSGDAAEDAARAQTEASKQGIEFQREALEALRQDLDPFRQFGVSALDPLSAAIGFQPQYEHVQRLDTANQMAGLSAEQQALLEADRADYERQVERRELLRRSYPGLKPKGLAAAPTFEAYREALGREPIEEISTESGKAVRVPRPAYGMVGTVPGAPSIQTSGDLTPPQNQLLQQAMQERAEFDPTGSPLLSRAAQERLDFDPLQNQLLQSAAERQMAMDPTQALGPEILQNPLLRALQDDVTRRLTANQAARGKLGSGGTAEALQQRLVPQAIQFGLQLNELQRQDISDRARLGGAQVGLQEAAMAGREGLGFGLSSLERQAISDRMQAGLTQEDLRQRQVANLMDAARLGQASAAQAGAAGQSAASQMGQLALAGGQAQAAGALGQAQARNQMIGGLASAGLGLLGGFTPTTTINPATGGFNTPTTTPATATNYYGWMGP